jgi:hypothetical protein
VGRGWLFPKYIYTPGENGDNSIVLHANDLMHDISTKKETNLLQSFFRAQHLRVIFG